MKKTTGVRSTQPASSFSFTHAAFARSPIEVRVYTDRPMTKEPIVTYGGLPMALTTKINNPGCIEHHYSIINVPPGSHVITGQLSEDAMYEIRLFENEWRP